MNARLQMVYVDLHHGDKDKAHARVEELLKEAPDDPSVLFVAADGPPPGRALRAGPRASTTACSR